MTVRLLTIYELTCSACGDRLPVDDYEPLFASVERAREQARQCDWWTDDTDVDLCEACKKEPHQFVAPVRTVAAGWCGRCGHYDDGSEGIHIVDAPLVPRRWTQRGPDLFTTAEPLADSPPALFDPPMDHRQMAVEFDTPVERRSA